MITKQEIKSTIKGFLLAVGSWFIILPLREKIVEISPIKDTLILGILIILFVLFYDN